MKPIIHKLIALIFVMSLVSLPVAATTEDPQYVHYKRMTMKFSGNNATVSLSFELDAFVQAYTLLMGSYNLEGDIRKMFYDFDEVTVSEIGKDYAVLRIGNVSHSSNGYYLHDSRKLGSNVSVLIMVYPSGATKQKSNAKETLNIFY
ncbi:MAG: hypothetical protein WBL02_08430 [Methanomethylovorans sp.]|uniref:hypothetical protein n=1 Tax=Methanomethylovorans sp. TaxID=2758717 RepID=UPI000A7EDE46|nr:hypothetical protein [Methanomethylovorans sp.]